MSDTYNAIFGYQPNTMEPEIDVGPSEPPTVRPRETAMDGSPARRPGDPDVAPTDDGEPIFSTDPLR